jgi:hypothetical protein
MWNGERQPESRQLITKEAGKVVTWMAGRETEGQDGNKSKGFQTVSPWAMTAVGILLLIKCCSFVPLPACSPI